MVFKGKAPQPERGVVESVFDPKTEKFICDIRGGVIDTGDNEDLSQALERLGYVAITPKAEEPKPEEKPEQEAAPEAAAVVPVTPPVEVKKPRKGRK